MSNLVQLCMAAFKVQRAFVSWARGRSGSTPGYETSCLTPCQLPFPLIAAEACLLLGLLDCNQLSGRAVPGAWEGALQGPTAGWLRQPREHLDMAVSRLMKVRLAF